jgi:hypothetical protein
MKTVKSGRFIQNQPRLVDFSFKPGIFPSRILFVAFVKIAADYNSFRMISGEADGMPNSLHLDTAGLLRRGSIPIVRSSSIQKSGGDAIQ